MLIPVSPVIPGLEDLEIVIAKDQPEYIPLPSLHSSNGMVIIRWALTEEQRKAIAEGADVFTAILTVGKPLQPLMVEIANVEEESSGDILHKFGITFVPKLDETILFGKDGGL